MANWLIGAVGVLLLAISVQTWRIEQLQDKAAVYKSTIAAHEDAARVNKESLDHCLDTNAENAIAAEQYRQAVSDAELRIARLSENLLEAENRVPIEVEQFNDETCRTLDQPLPSDFVDWLRDT